MAPKPLDPASLKFHDGRQMVVVDTETECWIWQGTKNKGYGRVRDGITPSKQAHIWTYENTIGKVPTGFELGHTCMRRSCVNPNHVEPVTRLQNNKDRYRFPHLSDATRAQIEELLLSDHPNGYISNRVGVSVWAVRKISREINWRSQLDLDLPF